MGIHRFTRKKNTFQDLRPVGNPKPIHLQQSLGFGVQDPVKKKETNNSQQKNTSLFHHIPHARWNITPPNSAKRWAPVQSPRALQSRSSPGRPRGSRRASLRPKDSEAHGAWDRDDVT